MAVTEADVRRIAELARLRVDDEALGPLALQLADILGHVDALTRARTTGVSHSTGGHGRDAMPLRQDAVAPAPMRVGVAGLAAETRDGFILVPRLATHEDPDGDG